MLKGKVARGAKNASFRNTMVVFQFTTSTILVVSSLIVYSQMNYLLNKKVGFDKDNMLMIQGAGTLGDKTTTFMEELENIPGIESVTNSNYFPVDGTNRDNNEFWIEGREKIDEGVGGQAWWVAHNYIPTMGMKILEGRNFSNEMAGDSAACIINKLMAEKLGLQDPVGKQIRNWRTWNIVGVVENFHFENMRQDIRPLVFFMGRGSASIVAARFQNKETASTITEVTNLWNQFMPNQPIRYAFLDDTFDNMYLGVRRTSNVFAISALLAILIACLGLFGLSTFMAEQRSKEISVRKVLGASTSNLFQLLTGNYMKFGEYLLDSWYSCCLVPHVDMVEQF